MATSKTAGSSIQPLPIPLMVVSALAAMVATGLIGGIFAQQIVEFSDGGALARVGLPVARTIHDIFATLTVGLLLVAGTMVPETTKTNRRESATRIATMTGAVWVLASLATLLLWISNTSGVSVAAPDFMGTVTSVVWSIDGFRAMLFSLIIATVAVVGSAVVKSTNGITWMAALSVIALMPLALNGHAAGAAAHDTAVNSLAIHIAAAVLWSGGLAALIILRPQLDGSALEVTVRRFSLLALWCIAGSAFSGVLNAGVRLGSPSALSSTYGLVVLAKVIVIGALAFFGWRMRSAIIPKLSLAQTARSAFVQFALLETVIMAAAIGIGVGLSRTPPPVNEEPSTDIATAITGYPLPADRLDGLGWLTSFRIDWLFFTGAVLAIVLYLAGVRRLHLRGVPWQLQRTIPWVLGWLIFIWVTSGAPGIYGRLQFSLHMLQHMTLSMAVPFCLVLGAPLTLALRCLPARRDKTLGLRELLMRTTHSRYLSFFANPIIAALNFFGSLIVFYFSGIFELAMRTHTGHVAMVIHFMLAGYMFCWVLVGVDPGPRRWAPSLRLVLLFATMSFHAFFGVALITGTTILGESYFRQLAVPWVPDLLADQVDGGAITWGIGEFPMLVLALMVALVWMRADEHDAKRLDRQADRDHDAALQAYNAELAARASRYEASVSAAVSRTEHPEDLEEQRPSERPNEPRSSTSPGDG